MFYAATPAVEHYVMNKKKCTHEATVEAPGMKTVAFVEGLDEFCQCHVESAFLYYQMCCS